MDISVFRAVRTMVLGTLILGVFAVVGLSSTTPVDAAEGINQRINFQGRLLNKQGATVPDGFYNIQFKIYQDGDGESANNATGSPAGSLEWTETRLNDDGNGVKIRNGYFSVELGSVTPFGTSIDWNQDTLWLSLNVGNTNSTCTPFSSCSPDGEMLPMKRLGSTPYALNAGMLGGRTAAGFIHNNAGTPQAANISIQSADVADVAATIQGAAGQTADIFQVKADSVATPLLAVSSAGSVTITPTSDASPALTVNSTTGTIFSASATAIALNENTTIASGKTLTVTGDTETNIAGYSGMSEGAITYDTDNGQLLVYSNGKWKADSTDAILVAASNSSQADKNAADFVADGTADQAEINDALTAASGKKVVLLAGTYTANETILVPNNTTLTGVGAGTLIRLADIDTDDNLIQNSDTTTGTGITIRDLKLDGQKALNSAGVQRGIHLIGMGGGTAVDIRPGANITGVVASDFRTDGISLDSSSNNIITGNVSSFNYAGFMVSSSNNNTISSNIMKGNNLSMYLSSSGKNIVDDNNSLSNSEYSFYLLNSNQNQITGNLLTDSGSFANNNAIFLTSSDNNRISSNNITDSTASFNNYAINIDNNLSDSNYISGNTFTTTPGTATIRDLGTSTVYTNQPKAENGMDTLFKQANSTEAFQVQNATGLAQLTADTSNSRIQIGSSTTDATAIVFALDNFNQAVDPTGVNGAMYYNTDSNKFRCYQDGAWIDCIGASAASYALDDLSNLTATSINQSLIANADNTLDLGSSVLGWRSGYFGTAVYSPLFDREDAGTLTIGGTNATAITLADNTNVTGRLAVAVTTASDVALQVQGAASQTGDLFQAKDSGGTNLMKVSANGSIAIGNGSEAITNNLGGSGRVLQIGSSAGLHMQINENNLGFNRNGVSYISNINTGGSAALNLGVGSASATAIQISSLNNVTITNSGTVGGTLAVNTALHTPLLDRANAGTLSIGGTNATSIAIGQSSTVTTLSSNTINVGSATADTTIQKTAQTTANTAGAGLRFQGATGNGTGAGGVVTIQGGTGGATNGNGGNLVLSGGTGTGSGVDGLVVLGTATFSTTTNDANCYTGGALVATSCTIALSSVNSSAAIIVGVSSADETVTLPDPTILTAGRVAYITAANNSQDFTLIVNGGGQGNEIAMRANTTATMIWSGSDWTAAGASSSTTLQAAYNNTLSSAGGAEIVLNNTATSNGLTVRNSASNAIIGGIFEAQTSIGSNLFSVNNNAAEFATNGGAETLGASASTFPASTWDTTTGGTVDRWTTAGNNIATGAASVRVQTTGANHGARNRISTPLTSGLTYSVSFAVRGATNFNTLDVRYSPDGSTSGTTQCSTAEVVTSGIWTRVNCTFIAGGAITANNSMLIRQTDGTSRTFYIDNLSITINASATYAADGSVDNAGAFGTNWTAYGAGSVAARDTSVIYDSSASARVNTTNAADRGIRNNLAIVPATNTQYLVSFYARSGSGAINDLTVRYSRDGGTNFTSCVDYNTQAINTSGWTKITCLFTTDSTSASNADLIITQATAPGGTRSIYIDALSITLNTNNANNVQIGGANKGGPTTLLTLDRSDSAPIAANNEAYLGSMYYDTTTGRIQCYEADGWGACGSAPDNIVNLSPEYAGAVLNGGGVGTMTADLCANETGVLQVNSSLCAVGESKNFYRWSSPQATQQTYSIYVNYQLPTTFKAFSSDDTVQLTARVDNTTNAAVTYEMFRSEGGTLTQCGSGETAVTTLANTWQTVGINGNEATGCGFNSNSGGAYVLFKINVKANSNANAFVSTLSFVTTGK